jgi:hypothetical protein
LGREDGPLLSRLLPDTAPGTGHSATADANG